MTPKQESGINKTSPMTKKETIQDLRDKVADVKWDLQRVLDILDTLYHEETPDK